MTVTPKIGLDSVWWLPVYRSPELTLSVSNLLNFRRRELAAAPEIGRLDRLRLTYRC